MPPITRIYIFPRFWDEACEQVLRFVNDPNPVLEAVPGNVMYIISSINGWYNLKKVFRMADGRVVLVSIRIPEEHRRLIYFVVAPMAITLQILHEQEQLRRYRRYQDMARAHFNRR